MKNLHDKMLGIGVIDMTTFSATLKEAMHKKNLSAKELSDKTGIHWTQISRYVNGHTEPSMETMAKLVKALDLNMQGEFAKQGLGPAPAVVLDKTFMRFYLPSGAFISLKWPSSNDDIDAAIECLKNLKR